MKLGILLTSFLLFTGCSKPSVQSHTSAAAPTGQGVIRGVVRFEGNPPAPQPIDTSQDPNCAKQLQSESFEVKDGKLQNVYIYVKSGLPEGAYPAPSDPAVLDQHGCRYTPHVLGIMTGQKLRILNSDPTMHNVHPAAKVNEGWNLSQSEHSQPAETSFSKPELMMAVQCNVHPWMKMYLNVSAHPYFAVSKDDGSFEIHGLPAGTYTVAALHEKLGEKTQNVTIKDGDAATLNFSFSASDSK